MTPDATGRSPLRLLAILLALLLPPAAAVAQEKPAQAMIVLDASGSMWGQIGGEAKISIARRVLSDVLPTMPKGTYLGLMAYGHREKGNCGDIEVLIAPAPGSAAEITGMAKDLSPKGKTPLSEAVRQAAEALRYTEEKATVILVTDGIETCRADPCAVGAELEASGVDFTAHVVGFGLSPEEGRQVACLAESTGGRYFPADDAASLGEALSDTVSEVAQAEPEEPEPAPAALPAASLAAPQSVEIGRRFSVAWDGPGENRDHIVLFDAEGNNGDGRIITSRRLANGDLDKKTLELVAPVKPGAYELQYVYGRTRDVLATATIEVVDAAVSLEAPASVAIGRTFTVKWVGPGGRRDAIEIIDPEGDGGKGRSVAGMRVANGDLDKREVKLVAPAEPGFYHLRYWNGDNREELASREIEILDAETSLSAPESVAMGTRFTVEWVGPGGRRDAVEVFDETGDGGRGKVVGSMRLANGDYDGGKVELVAPAEPGSYLLRYWNGDNRTVLATRPIAVEEMAVSLAAPDSIAIGHLLRVEWAGPGARRDAVEIFDAAALAGKGKVVASKRLANGDMKKRVVELAVPVKPGDYVLRYWNGDSRAVLAERTLRVEAMDVALEAPDAAEAGATIEIAWSGPGAYRDAVEIFDPRARGGQGKAGRSTRLVNGDYDNRKVKLKMPDEPGDYLLRYWNGDYGAVLAERPIAVK
ncbi:MAG: VWA domain-containing protein [Flavobacteriaceae bacterium]